MPLTHQNSLGTFKLKLKLKGGGRGREEDIEDHGVGMLIQEVEKYEECHSIMPNFSNYSQQQCQFWWESKTMHDNWAKTISFYNGPTCGVQRYLNFTTALN